MSEEKNIIEENSAVEYDEGNIQTLTGLQHIRLRPGMYIGRLGDGSSAEDGIYVLLKEVFDNSIDEFKMKAGERIEVNVEDNLRISVRDYGRGIPQGKLIESVSILNTSGKFDSKAFKKSIGLNGVGVKAVNALSSHFEVHSYRDGKVRKATFECGELVSDVTEPTQDENGTYIYFEPDNTKFQNYQFHDEIVENMLRNYTYLNIGLTIMYNGRRILSRHGLEDLLKDRMTNDALYPIIHLQGDDIEIAFTHANQYGEEYYSFVNGQHTTQGGTHQSAFKEHIARTIKDFFNKYEWRLTTTCISIRTLQKSLRIKSRRVNASARKWLVSRRKPVNVPRRPICTIESYATVASISVMQRTTARKSRASSLLRATQPAEVSPRVAT